MTLVKACELEDNPSNIAIISSFDVILSFFLNIIFLGVEVSYIALLGSIIVMISIIIIAKSKESPKVAKIDLDDKILNNK